MLNRIIIMGRLTATPELKKTQTGVSVCSITVAVDRDHRNDGEKVTDFIEVVAWRQTAEFICNYFTKGKAIIVDGHMQSRKWTDKNGQNRLSWEIEAERIHFADSKSEKKESVEDLAKRFDEMDDPGELPF